MEKSENQEPQPEYISLPAVLTILVVVVGFAYWQNLQKHWAEAEYKTLIAEEAALALNMSDGLTPDEIAMADKRDIPELDEDNAIMGKLPLEQKEYLKNFLQKAPAKVPFRQLLTLVDMRDTAISRKLFGRGGSEVYSHLILNRFLAELQKRDPEQEAQHAFEDGKGDLIRINSRGLDYNQLMSARMSGEEPALSSTLPGLHCSDNVPDMDFTYEYEPVMPPTRIHHEHELYKTLMAFTAAYNQALYKQPGFLYHDSCALKENG